MLEEIEGRRRRGQQRMRRLDGVTDSIGHGFEQTPEADDGQGSLGCCSTWGHKESDTIGQLNWTGLIAQYKIKSPNIKQKKQIAYVKYLNST